MRPGRASSCELVTCSNAVRFTSNTNRLRLEPNWNRARPCIGCSHARGGDHTWFDQLKVHRPLVSAVRVALMLTRGSRRAVSQLLATDVEASRYAAS